MIYAIILTRIGFYKRGGINKEVRKATMRKQLAWITISIFLYSVVVIWVILKASFDLDKYPIVDQALKTTYVAISRGGVIQFFFVCLIDPVFRLTFKEIFLTKCCGRKK